MRSRSLWVCAGSVWLLAATGFAQGGQLAGVPAPTAPNLQQTLPSAGVAPTTSRHEASPQPRDARPADSPRGHSPAAHGQARGQTFVSNIPVRGALQISPDPDPNREQDLFRAGRDIYAPRYDRLESPGSGGPYFFPGASWYVSTGFGLRLRPAGFGHRVRNLGSAAWSPEPGVRESGFLQLDVQPAAAEVYVDGYYVGTVADVAASGFGLELEARPHRVELRASGFESAAIDVRIVSNGAVTFRRVLTRIDDPPAPVIPAPAPATPKTLYVVPRCYAGDTPPTAAQLPAGCDPANVRIIPPSSPSR